MEKIEREDLNLIAAHSNIPAKSLKYLFEQNVYNDKIAWQKFLKIFFVTLGAGFTVAGIIFFFAYNWDDLNKFAKIGLIEGLIIITAIFALIPKININIRNIILTVLSVLVGVLFAVFGQVYQTGANAYDFFLGWTVFITLWVIISNYPPLWLLYILLINVTFFLYTEQAADNISELTAFSVHFFLLTSILVLSQFIKKYLKSSNIPEWFLKVVTLAAVSYGTFTFITIIHWNKRYDFDISIFILAIIVLITYGIGLFYGFKQKSIFYLSIIPMSLIIIFNSLLFRIFPNGQIYLLSTIFILICVTSVIIILTNFQKKWSDA